MCDLTTFAIIFILSVFEVQDVSVGGMALVTPAWSSVSIRCALFLFLFFND